MTLCDYDSRTALHIAVSDKQEHVVDFLLEDENFRNHIKDKKDRYEVKIHKNDTGLKTF